MIIVYITCDRQLEGFGKNTVSPADHVPLTDRMQPTGECVYASILPDKHAGDKADIAPPQHNPIYAELVATPPTTPTPSNNTESHA